MRVVCSKKTEPLVWRGKYAGCEKAVLEKNIKLGTLRMKLLVFRTLKDLRKFWETAEPTKRGGRLGCRVSGVVKSMMCDWTSFPKGKPEVHRMEVDRRFFAVMGLITKDLDIEVVTHESVHAAYAYSKRTRSRNIWSDAVNGLDEELVCYPAGRIAALVLRALKTGGVLENGRVKV